MPLNLLPRPLRALVEWLPFRYQIALPVELMTGAVDRARAAALLGRQWGWVAALLALTLWTWRRGVRRFAAYGG